MRRLTNHAHRFCVYLAIAASMAACAQEEAATPVSANSNPVFDATNDANGVVETLATSAMAIGSAPSISIDSPPSNKSYTLPDGSSGVVVMLDVSVSNAEVAADDYHIRYYLDGEEVETISSNDGSYMMLNVPMGRRHIAARLVTSDGDVLPDTPSSLDAIYVRVEAECQGVGDDGAVQCDDGLVCSNEACGSSGTCKYGQSNIAGCCDNDLECGYGSYCVDNLCVECISDAECADELSCTVDSCNAEGQCVHEAQEGCCDVDADCDDGLYCTLEYCNIVDRQCVYEDNPLPKCCNNPGPNEFGDPEMCAPPDACTNYLCYRNHKLDLQYCRYGPAIAGCCTDDSMCNDGNICTLDSCDFEAGDIEGAGMCTSVKDPAKPGCCVHKYECDDNNPATIDNCVDNLCEHTVDPSFCSLPATSAIVINEIMAAPGTIADSVGEYIEIFNATDEVIDLTGWRLEVNGESHLMSDDNTYGNATMQLVPKAYYVLSRYADPALDGFVKPHYIYGDAIDLPDTTSGMDGPVGIAIRDANGSIVDSVIYDETWPMEDARSLELTHPWADNALPSSWRPAGKSVTPAFNVTYSSLHNVKGSPRTENRSSYQGLADANCPLSGDLGVCGAGFCNMEGKCEEKIAPGCCETTLHCKDHDPCTVESCNLVTNTCDAPVAIDGCCVADDECSDDNACNYDRCIGGICRFSPTIIPDCCSVDTDCDDSDACTIDICDTEVGACGTPEPVVLPDGQVCCNLDEDCDDGTAATDDYCVSNVCEFVPAADYCVTNLDCEADPNPCLEVYCNPLVARCETLPKIGCCGSDSDCNGDDGDACTDHVCDSSTNSCVFEKDPSCCNGSDDDCEDGEPCTKDKCINTTCHFEPIEQCCFENADCSDGSPCTVDLCVDNECSNQALQGCCNEGPAGDPLVQAQCGALPDDAPICGSWSCTADGTCVVADPGNCCTTNSDCDDGSSCTLDLCNIDNTCKFVPQPGDGCCTTHSDCEDGQYCGELGECEEKCAETDSCPCTDDVECATDNCVKEVAGACSPADQASIDGTDLNGTVMGCVGLCSSKSDPVTCLENCVKAAFAVSNGCISCLEGMSDELNSSCNAECFSSGGPSPNCLPCAQLTVDTIYNGCTGDEGSVTGVCEPKKDPMDFCTVDSDCGSNSCVSIDTDVLLTKFAEAGACNSDSSCLQAVLGHLGVSDLTALSNESGCALNANDGVTCGYCCINEDNLGKPCDSQDLDLCTNGTFTCNADALGDAIALTATGGAVPSTGYRECVNETVEDLVEKCSGLDDNCDGNTDEGYDQLGESCGVGQCAGGELQCNANGDGYQCSTAPGGVNNKATAEICDGEDNDCNGTSDDGLGVAPLVTKNAGVCAGMRQVCGGALGWVDPDFSSVPGYEAVELSCDGIDNDCDGEVDNDLPAPAADKLLGTCANSVKVCAGSAGWQEPNYFTSTTAFQVNETICDGIDNDCDGEVDEILADGSALVAAPADKQKGVCAGALKICTGSQGWAEPNYFTIDGYEGTTEKSCDGLDNNCSGYADDTFNIGQGCDGPDADTCANGKRVCNAAGTGAECEEPQPEPFEVCDGLDNDCNGAIDEPFADQLGNTCDGPDSDQCENGSYGCAPDGTLGCFETEEDIIEVCNGLDDDCDGEIDEGEVCANACPELMNSDEFEFRPVIECTLDGSTGGTTWADVQVEGEANVGPFGTMDFTGTMEKTDATGPTTWCITGSVSIDLPVGIAIDASTVKLCKTIEQGAVVYVGSFEGEITVDGGRGAGYGDFTLSSDFTPWTANAYIPLLRFSDCFTFVDVKIVLNELWDYMVTEAAMQLDLHFTFTPPVSETCGDGICNNGEFPDSCAADCPGGLVCKEMCDALIGCDGYPADSFEHNACVTHCVQGDYNQFGELVELTQCAENNEGNCGAVKACFLSGSPGEEDEVVDLPEFNAPGAPMTLDMADEWKPNDPSAEMAVRQWFGTSFYPMPQTDHYTVEGMEGVYRNDPTSGREVSLTGFKELALIERWLGVNDITTDIRLSGDCTYDLAFAGTLNLGVFGTMDLEGAFVQTRDTQMTGTLTAEFERDILGLIQLNNAFVQITIDEESIKDFIWGADVYLIGLEFSVDGWFEISEDGELTRACFSIAQLDLGFGSLDVLNVENLEMCFPFDCSEDGLALGTCDGRKKNANIIYLFDTSADGGGQDVDSEEFEPYLDNFFSSTDVPDDGPISWDYVQPNLPNEPVVHHKKQLGYWVALQKPLEAYADHVNPALKYAPPRGFSLSYDIDEDGLLQAEPFPGIKNSVAVCSDRIENGTTNDYCDCDPGAITYDADPYAEEGTLGGACIYFSPFHCGDEEVCCKDDLVCTGGVCTDPNGTPPAPWWAAYAPQGEEFAPTQLGFNADTPLEWPFYRDYLLGKNSVWFTTPVLQRPAWNYSQFVQIAWSLQNAGKIFKDEDRLYNIGGFPGTLNGECLEGDGPSDYLDDDERCPGLVGIDPLLHCVEGICRDKARPGPWERRSGDNAIILVTADQDRCSPNYEGQFPEITAAELREQGIDTYVIAWRNEQLRQFGPSDKLNKLAVAGGHPEPIKFLNSTRYKEARDIEELEQHIADATGEATCDGTFTSYPGCSMTFKGRTTFLAGVLGDAAPRFDLDGFWVPGGDYEFNVELVPDTDWEIIPGIGPVVTELDGALTYSELEDVTTLDVEATVEQVDLLGLITLTDTTVGALVSDNGTWQYTLDGDADIVLLGEVALSGNVEKVSPTAPITGCLSGVKSEPLDLLGIVTLDDLAVSTCFEDDLYGGTELKIEFSGDLMMDLLDGPIGFEGKLTLPNDEDGGSANYELELTLYNVPLILVQVDMFKLLLIEGGSSFEVYGEFAIPGLSSLEMTLQGFYEDAENFSFTLALQEGTTWTPFAGFDLTFDELSGTYSREGVFEEISISATQADGWQLMPAAGVALVPVTINASYRFIPGTEYASWSFGMAGTLTLGVLGEVALEGEIAQDGPGMPLYGTLVGTVDEVDFLGLGWLVLSPFTVSLEFADNEVSKIGLSGSLEIFNSPAYQGLGVGGVVDFTGEYIPGPPYSLSLTIDELGLGSLATLRDFEMVYDSELGNFEVSAETTLDFADNPNDFAVFGNIQSNGDFELGVSLKPGQLFEPLAQFGLKFTEVDGWLKKSGQGSDALISANISACSAASLAIVPGFVIHDVCVGTTFTDSEWESLSISGTTVISFGDSSFTLIVSAVINADGTFVFQGEFAGELQPFRLLLGNDVFILHGATLLIDFGSTNGGSTSWSLTVTSVGTLKVLGNTYAVAVTGGYEVDGSGEPPTAYLSGVIETMNLPGLGGLNGIWFVVSSDEYPEFDIYATPDDPGDDILVRKGLSLGTTAPSPVPLSANEADLSFFIYVDLEDPNILRVEANVPLDWTVIPPGSFFEAVDIEEITFRAIQLFIDISLDSYVMGFGALLDFYPVDHSKLIGTVEIFVDFLAPSLGVTMWLEGQWREPLNLTNFVVENPGFTLELPLTATPPVPDSIGAALDLYWVRDGNFPPMDSAIVAGDNVVQVGSSFFLDRGLSESGLCFPTGGCAILPTVHFRLEVANMNFPADFISFTFALTNAVTDMFGGFIPNVPLPELDFSPFEIQIDTLLVQATTHDLELFGKLYDPGFEVLFDGEIFGVTTYFRGYLNTDGLELYAEVEPFEILGITFTGNPFSRVANTGSGFVQMPHDAKFNSDTFTVEGHVYRDQYYGGANASTLVKKMDGSNGFKITVGQGSDETGAGKVTVTIKNGGQTRTLTTKRHVVKPAEWQHLAVVFDRSGNAEPDGPGDQYPVAVYVDGRYQRLIKQGPDIGPGITSSPAYWGLGMEQIDDIRVWNDIRLPSEITGNQRVLPLAAYGYDSLITRYEFDFDNRSDSNEAYNYKLYTSGNRLHGSHQGSSVQLDDNQSLMLKLVWPFGDPLGSGFWLRAGYSINIPVLSDFFDFKPEGTVQVAMGDGEFSGEFYFDKFLLLPVPFLGNFVMSGYGQNLHPGDFDDGLYGAFNLTTFEVAMTASVAFQGNRDNGIDFDKTFAGAYFNYFCPEDTACSPLTNQLEVGFDLDLVFTIGPLGDWGIEGHARLETEGPLFRIEGALVIAGQELISGAMELSDERLYLETTFDLPTVFGFDFGEINVMAELAFSPFRLCVAGDMVLAVPFIDLDVDSAVGVCLGHDPYFLIHGSLSTGNILGFQLEELSVTVAMGNVPATYQVKEGIQFVGRLRFAGIIDVSLTGMVLANGQFEFTGAASLNIPGTGQGISVEVTFNNSGIKLSAFASVLGITVAVEGALYSDGSFELTGMLDISLLGQSLANCTLSVSSWGGFKVTGAFDFGVIAGYLEMEISGADYSLEVGLTVKIAGFTLANATMSASGSGLTIANVSICLELPDIGWGKIQGCAGFSSLDIGFEFSADITFNPGGFQLASAVVKLNATEGFYVAGSLDCILFAIQVSGAVTTNFTMTLTGAGQVTLGIVGVSAYVDVSFTKGSGLLFGLGGTIDCTLLGVAVAGNFYIDTGGNFDFGATGTIGGCLPKLPYPCIETQCNTVCVPLPCVKGCATWLYGVCVVPIPGFCTSCATVCVPVPTLCYAEVGCLTCTVNFNITNSGLKDPIGASCTVPIVGTIGVSLSASCGKVCVNVSLFGATANLCTPCLW